MMNGERGETALGDIALRFTVNRLCIAETAGKLRIPAMLMAAEMGGGFSVSDVRLLLWAGRINPPEGWTLDAAGELIDQLGFTACALAARAAVMAAFPPPDEGEKGGEA